MARWLVHRGFGRSARSCGERAFNWPAPAHRIARRLASLGAAVGVLQQSDVPALLAVKLCERCQQARGASECPSNPRLPGRLRLDQTRTCALPAHRLGPERGKERTHVAGKIWLQLLWPGRDKRVFKVRGRRGVLGFEIGRKGRERGGRDVGTVRLVIVVEWAWRNRRDRRRGHSRRL